jgi:protein import protein ZIM17
MSALKTTTTRTLRHILPSLSLRPLLTPRLLPLIHSNPYATTTTSLLHSLPSPPPPKPLPSIPVSPPTSDATPVKTAIGKIERRLQITFTCTAHLDPTDENAEGVEQECRHRSTHEFSRTSYEKGIVLIQCPGCGNRHLIGPSLPPPCLTCCG